MDFYPCGVYNLNTINHKPMNINLSEKDKTELTKFIDNILYFANGKNTAAIPFRSFDLSAKYEDLEEMEMEAELLIKKLQQISKSAISKYELQTSSDPNMLDVWGVKMQIDPNELKRIRSLLVSEN